MTRWWRSHTVRVRLTLWYVAAVIVVLGVYISVVYAFVGRNASQNLDQQLRQDFQWAAATVDVAPDGVVTFMAEPQLITGEEELPWVQVWDAAGRTLQYQSSEAARRAVPGGATLAPIADDRGFTAAVPVPSETAPMRILSRRLPIRDQPMIIQVGRSEAPMRADLRDLAFRLTLGFPIAIAVAGLGGYTLARRALMPIERMTERAQHITAERLGERLPVHNPDDEMGRLASVFNETLGRLEESFEQMRRFTADVSHELRTPLTAIRSVGEVGLRGHRDDAAYRTIIGSMLEEADRLASLVDRLLTISRAETGQSTLQREDVEVMRLAEEVVAHLGVLAEEKGQTVTIEGERDASALADRLVLRQALINLVDNAIKFSRAGGAICVRIAATAGEVLIEVTDSGPGVPAEASARIFDRFYRAANADAGGTGLGLSIAKGTVEATGGRLTLEQTSPSGSTFRITLPRVR